MSKEDKVTECSRETYMAQLPAALEKTLQQRASFDLERRVMEALAEDDAPEFGQIMFYTSEKIDTVACASDVCASPGRLAEVMVRIAMSKEEWAVALTNEVLNRIVLPTAKAHGLPTSMGELIAMHQPETDPSKVN